MKRLFAIAAFSAAALVLTGGVAIGAAIALDWIVPSASPDFAIRGQLLFLAGRPFSGLAYDLYPNRRPQRVRMFVDGLETGTEIQWYGNGGRWLERRYQAGVPSGEWRMWHPNGRVKYLGRYVAGKPDGEAWAWHANGHVAEYSLFAMGQTIARKVWLFDGTPYHNYVHQEGSRVGVVGGDYCKTRNPANMPNAKKRPRS